jgi:hypothetical protein
MFLAVNLTRVTSTWVFLHPVVTCPPDPALKMGGPSILRFPASHLLAMPFVMHLSVPLPPLRILLTIPSCPIQKGVCTLCLPKIVLALLNNPLVHSISFHNARKHPCTSILVAESGATNHMTPDKSAFISYYPVSERWVCMGNNSFAPILGHRSAIISLNRKVILIWHCLHVPDLPSPLYSL